MDNYIFITEEASPILPIAHRLAQEGKTVVVGYTDPEKEIEGFQEKRGELYCDMIDPKPAEQVFEDMRQIETAGEQDEWFVMFDYGNLWPHAQKALDMGFKKGVFVTEEGYSLEKDRQKAKQFAEQHYHDLHIQEAQQFKSVEDGVKFLEENSDKIYVLKSDGSDAETVVPGVEDPELARRQVIGALRTEAKDYEHGGFTLEEKIKNPVEISPVMVFWDGEPLFSLVEIENKNFGAGNIGRLTGGCQNLTMRTPLDCQLNQIAFPEIVHQMAAKQPGVGIYDAGLLWDGRRFCFTEFCSQRWGWDGIFSEIAMSGGASKHFDGLAAGKSPIVHQYGAAVRLFQTEPHGKLPGMYKDGYNIAWDPEVTPFLWLNCITKKQAEGEEDEFFASVGFRKDLGVATGASNYLQAAVDEAYFTARNVAMTGLYYRPRLDFLSTQYKTSIMNRHRWLVNSGLV